MSVTALSASKLAYAAYAATPVRFWVAWAAAAFLELGCELAIPKTIQVLLAPDSFLPPVLTPTFLVMGLVLLYVARFLAGLAGAWAAQVNQWNLASVLRGKLLGSLLRVRRPLDRDVGGAVELIENDVARAKTLLGGTLPALAVSAAMVIGALVVVAESNAFVAAWLAAATVFAIYSLNTIRMRATAAWDTAGAARKRTTSFAESVFSGALDLFVNHQQPLAVAKVDELMARQMKTVTAAYTRERLVWPFAIALFGVCHAVSFLILGLSGAADPGLFVAVFLYTELIRKPVEATVGNFAVLQDGLTSLKRSAASTRLAKDDVTGATAGYWSLHLEFAACPLTYMDCAAPLLAHGSIEVRPGEVLLLQGRTGSGKSSLGQFLAGISLAEGPRPSNEQGPLPRVAYIGQREPIFDMSVADNIRLFAAKVELPTYIQCCASNMGLPPDLATRALDLQQQAQRDAIVFLRGLVCDAQLVIYDEPFAAGEPNLIRVAASMLEQHMGHRAYIIISHRREWRNSASRIYVIDPDASLIEERPMQGGLHEPI